MPIKYIPDALGQIANGPWSTRRLKNRTGRLKCDGCSLQKEGHLLDLINEAKTHDESTGHDIRIIEGPCRMGLIEQR